VRVDQGGLFPLKNNFFTKLDIPVITKIRTLTLRINNNSISLDQNLAAIL